MILENIKSPEDLKKVNEKKLRHLCEEIREYIDSVVNKNGGHLASNLGVVELTVAMHRSFDMPKDKIIFDVGHQSYTHKILTGRYEAFKTLRQYKGLSGFPKRSESPYDSFNTGHSSTSISAALGIATARDIEKEDFQIVASIGDGALTGGMAFEAMNHLGHLQSKIIIVLNDNEMSISENIGGVSKYLSHLSSGNVYRHFKQSLNVVLFKTIVGRKIRRVLSRFKGSIKYLFSKKGIFFEQFGLTYLGPYDGHDVIGLEEGFRIAKFIDGPVLFHVITIKGKGNKTAECNPEKFHGISPKKRKKNISLTKSFGLHLVELAKKNKKITTITAAMCIGTGLDIFRKEFPKRFFDVSIAEQHGLTFAAGQSIQGLRPVISIYSTFMQRGVDQIIHDICLQNLPVTMISDRAGLIGEDGETHHGVFDIALFGAIPNLVFMEPKDSKELKDMLTFATEYNGPTMIRFPKESLSIYNIEVSPIVLGEMEMILDNNGIYCIVALGTEGTMALYIAEELKKKNILIDVINPRFIKPINQSWIDRLNNYKQVFTIENHVVVGGFGSLVKSQLDKTKVYNFGLPNVFISQGSIEEIRKEIGFTKNQILREIEEKIFE